MDLVAQADLKLKLYLKMTLIYDLPAFIFLVLRIQIYTMVLCNSSGAKSQHSGGRGSQSEF